MPRRPPRLLVKTMTVTFATVALIVVLVLIAVVVTVRSEVRQSVTSNLESGQRIFAALEARRQRELRGQVSSLAENPTLKAAVDTYQAERKTSDTSTHAQLLTTIDHELAKLAAPIDCDAVLLVDTSRNLLAASGRLAPAWVPGQAVRFGAARPTDGFDGIMRSGSDVFRALGVPLLTDGDIMIGGLYVMTRLDAKYAQELGAFSRTRIAIVSDDGLVAATLPARAAAEFGLTRVSQDLGTVTLDGDDYVFRRLIQIGDTAFFGLASIDESARAPMNSAMLTLGIVAFGATALAFAASLWLARIVSEPIGRLSQSLTGLNAPHALATRLALTGSSREIDALTDTFNALMASLAQAEHQTQEAYTGAIRALATALDARDPYTAGHSERVSVLSVSIGRVLGVGDEDLEVLRLGALLHDIGKIGVPDDILMKPGPLTDAEIARIRQHPGMGARILRSVPFLAPHLPIVELHHERPDGDGYPHGLRGDDIPLLARIVHVADAYDAITSARAYRVARPSEFALNELWRCAGTEYHAEIVGALAIALPRVTSPRPQRAPAPEAVRA